MCAEPVEQVLCPRTRIIKSSLRPVVLETGFTECFQILQMLVVVFSDKFKVEEIVTQ